MKKYLVLLFVLGMFSCQNSKKEEIIRINDMVYQTVIDTIYSRMPGSMLCQNGIVYWHDVFSSEGIIHAVDIKTGKELKTFGNVGNGPKEFTYPLLSLSPDGGLCIADGNKSLDILYKLENKTDSLYEIVSGFEKDKGITRVLQGDGGDKLLLYPGKKRMFETYKDGKWYMSDS